MTIDEYRDEERRINTARAAAIGDLDRYLCGCGLSVDQRNKAMDLLVPIVAHVKAPTELKLPMDLKAMRDELRQLASLLKDQAQTAQTQSAQYRPDQAA